MNKHKKCAVGICMLAGLLLAGCGQAKVPEVVDTTSIAVSDDGTVTSYLIDVFDKDYYNLSELKVMAVKEAAEYNTEHQSGETVPVTVEKVESVGDGSNKVVVVHKYDSADTFADYNESVLFYGTVADAVKEGYSLAEGLKSVKDEADFSEDEIIENLESFLLITSEKAKIYCPDKVTHISENAVYCDDGSVDSTAAEGNVVIFMK